MQQFMEKVSADIQQAVDFIKQQIKFTTPYTVGIILGSGLGELANTVENPQFVPYNTIPGFPVSTAPGHVGRFVFGTLSGVRVIAMQGRVHMYEGYEPSVVTIPVRVMRLLGCSKLLVTNACGAVNLSYRRQDLMLISDHINFTGKSPLAGPNLSLFGPRFPDMGAIYTPRLRQVAKDAAAKLGLSECIKEGVYACMPGPMYETPAEIKMLRILGVDAVGMSTVMESIVARHCGMETLGISCVCNMAAGIVNEVLTEEDVLKEGAKRSASFMALVREILPNM